MPLGPIDPNILRRLRTTLAKYLSLPVRVLHPHPLPLATYHATRDQYNASQLLEFILNDEENEAFRVLGVTAVDLYIPIFTFVFGEAQVDGKAALISVFRPRGDAGGPAPSFPVLLERLTKLGLHELGHTFGLKHCLEEGCLMEFSTNLAKLDQKKMAFCGYCQVMLADYFRDQGLPPPSLKQYAKIPAPGAPTLDADNSRKHHQ